MKKWIACMMLAYAGLVLSAGANATNSWLFDIPSQYTVSDPTAIEVTNGVARLKLQAQQLRQMKFAEYLGDTATRTDLALGPDNSITLTKFGAMFSASGVYESEIFDGGSQGAWRNFKVREVLPKDPAMAGLVAYYPMDRDNWLDFVSRQYGTPVGNVGFSSPGRNGGSAGTVYGTSATDTLYLANASLLNGVSAFTICLWINIAKFTPNAGFVQLYDTPSGEILFFRQGTSAGSINIGWYSPTSWRILDVPNFLSTNSWGFLTVTMNAAVNNAKPILYGNGTDYNYGTFTARGTFTTVKQTKPFEVGTGFGVTNQIYKGLFDEVMIFNRALAPAEVMGLYLKSKYMRHLSTQIRSGPTTNLTSAYVGPDGTTNSYFWSGNNLVSNMPNFSVIDRFVQVRALLEATGDLTLTPYLDSISWFKDRTYNLENTYVDFSQGKYTTRVTNSLALPGTPYIGLAKNPQGGYNRNGTYISPVFDNGGGGTWDQIAWSVAPELMANIPGLEGLWHLNGTWGDASGKGRSATPPTPELYSSAPKLGTKAALFNGATTRATIPLPTSLQIQTIEFWLKAANPIDGILEVAANTTYLSLSNQMIVATGFTNAPVSIYVNARQTPRLGPGWNYVVLTTESAATNLSLTIGAANDDFFEGEIDELAIYSRALSSGEIEAHYNSARPRVGGQLRLQTRSDSINPPQTLFAGPGNDPLRYFEDPNGGAPGQVQRYFQYCIYMDSDGLASPALDSVSITYNSVVQRVDDTLEEFSQGQFNGTRWVGDGMGALDLYARGPANLDTLTISGYSAILHMDEEAWPPGDSVKDSSGSGNHGTPMGDVYPVIGAQVGARCGSFDGSGDAISVAIPIGINNFSVEAWFQSTATNRCAILSTYQNASAPFLALELNSDGTGTSAVGRVAFVVSNGTTPQTVSSDRAGLNDGVWHHLAGVRDAGQLYLFLDGLRIKTVEIGVGYPSPGNASGFLAKMGSQNVYFRGCIDEVVVYTRALTDAEVAERAAAGYNTLTPAVFVSPVISIGLSALWDKLGWVTDASYSRPTEPGDIDLRGLWPMDVVTAGWVADVTGNGHTGWVTGAVLDTAGKFSNCVAFTGGGDQRIVVADQATLEPPVFTIEAWIQPTLSHAFMTIDKSDDATGYRLGADLTGRYYFWVNGTTATDFEPLRAGQWTHVAGVYDGAVLRLYVNGIQHGKTTLPGALVDSAAELRIGLDRNNNGDFSGKIDEVVLTARALNVGELWDHYVAGVATLKFQARSWDPGPQGNFIGPDRTPNTYFTRAEGSDLLGVLGINLNFQYQAVLATEDYRWTPRLQGVWVDISGYPVNNPWVIPADGFGFPFLGRLTGFAEKPGPLNQGRMKYFVSGDNGTNWYYWNTTWQNAGTFGYDFANNATEMQAHIGDLRDQVFPNVGGTFKFKAFLNSAGSEQVELDQVDLAHSTGRLVVTVPNGAEVGEHSWVVGYPETIRWVTQGTVSHNLSIEWSTDSGTNWMPIAAGVSNLGSYVWTPPGSAVQDEQYHARIRISDLNDSTIWDTSDADFEIKWRFNVTSPNGGEKWYIGRTNTIRWEAARNLNTVVIDLSPDGSNYNRNIAFGYAGVGGTSNQFVWALTNRTSGYYANWVSETARIRVQSLAGFGSDASDNPFTLAGIVITDPTSVSAWKKGDSFNILWAAAGAGSTVKIEFSATGPAGPYAVIAGAAPNVPGTNSYLWQANVNPTPMGVFRITSNSDPALVGISEQFTVADITLLDPVAGTNWLMNTAYKIHWLAAGAGNQVNIYYSTNSGLGWIPITATPFASLNTPQTNEYVWTVQPYPTRYARIRVESVIDPENLFGRSSDFNIAGVKILSPKGGDKWSKGSLTNSVVWAHQSAGSTARLRFSYDGGLTYSNVASFSVNLSDLAFPYTPIVPTVRGVARIDADDPSPFTNMWSTSDTNIYMTVAGILMETPTNGASYTMGTVNEVKWISAGSEDSLGQAWIYYANDGVNFTNLVATVGNNQAFPGGNTYNWPVSPLLLPSGTARLRVDSGDYSHQTPPFTLRGIRINQPAVGSPLTIGGNAAIAWKQAGLSSDALMDMYLSTDGGTTWTPTPLNDLPWPVNAETYAWSPVNPSADPTTNAVIRMTIVSSSTPADVGYEARSRAFTLQGMKIVAPVAGDIWELNGTNAIRWLAAGAGSPVTIQYSPNGVTFDPTPIVANLLNGDGPNSYQWAIESSRMPTTNARIRIQSTLSSAISPVFQVHGIRVTAPVNTDIWAKEETNRITWLAVGTLGHYTVELIKDGGPPELLANDVTTPYFDWVISSNSISSNAIIRVTDSGGYRGDSLRFQVVGEPTINLVQPAPGEYWRVSDPVTISWSRGGKMANNFSVKYSTPPYVITNDIVAPVTYDPTNNTFNMPWTVPDRIGPCRLRVQHNDEPTIFAESAIFYVVGYFTVIYPNGGENNLYADKPATVNWYTRGSVNAVNLYYSADPLHQVWSLIASHVPNNGLGLSDVLSSYTWKVPNLWADDVGSVRIRVEEADRLGASDDSDADFWIRYYTITWNVFNQATSNALDQLSVSDSSGWSAAGLASPVIRKYPYGTFDTVWSRALFVDKVVFNWLSEPSRSLFVPMVISSAEADFKVLSNFYYDAGTNRFYIQSWIERSGNIQGNPSSCTISIFDRSGTLISTLAESVADAQGVFWQEWNIPTFLDRRQIYFAKVEIVYSGAKYSSGVTYSLRMPADLEQAEVILGAIDYTRTSILANVMSVGSNVTTMATAAAAFQLSAGARLDTLTNLALRIAAGVTNLDSNLEVFHQESLTRLNALTNTIGVIGPGGTTLVERVADVTRELEARTARILTRPTTVRLGTTVSIYYRTKPGVSPAPTLRVRDHDGVERLSATMTDEALGTGIFGYTISFDAPAYSVGEYWVECADATGNDRIGIQVTSLSLDDLSTLLEVSNQIDRISLLSSNIQLTVATLAPLSNLITVVDRVETEVRSLTNLPARIDRIDQTMSNRLTRIDTGLDQVALLSSNLQTSVTRMTPLTNLFGVISNIDLTIRGLSSLTNVSTTIDNLNTRLEILNSLANIGPVISSLSAVMDSADLPTMSAKIDEIALKLANYQSTPNGLNSLDTTAVPEMLKYLEDIHTQLITQAGISTQVTAAMKKASSASSAASKAGTAAQAVKRELGQGRIDEAVKMLTDLRKSLSEAKLDAGTEVSPVTAVELDKQLDALIQRMNELAGQKGAGLLMSEVAGIKTTAGRPVSPAVAPTAGSAPETVMGVSIADHDAIVQLNARLEETRAMMTLLQALMEQTVNKPVVVDWLESGKP